MNRSEIVLSATQASALQVRRAYERHFNRKMPSNMSYHDVAGLLTTILGIEEGNRLILAEPNDPNSPEPLKK